MDVTTHGLRIFGDEDTANAHAHRERYRFAAQHLACGSTIADRGTGLMHVLDYGCGTGYGSQILRNKGLYVTSVDDDKDVIAYAWARWGAFIHRTIPAERFDAVVAFEILEHVAPPPLATLRMLMRLAPIVVASVPYREPPGNPHHVWFDLDEQAFEAVKPTYLYQQADGSIGPTRGDAQNLIVIASAGSA
jgi:SAM-dependent methyltransferase